MKMGLILASILLSGCVVAAPEPESAQQDPVTESGTVKIEWQAPEKYRDVRSASENNEKFRLRVFKTLTESLAKDASKLLKENEKIELVVTDLDLAGDLRPTFGATASDLRIVKSIYPPRITFSYRVFEGDDVIMVGSEKLRDPGFLDRSYLNDQDSFRFEKDMLKRWLRETVAPKA
ncbi:DUF3016 domain-containing protein [Shewanella sp.]|uniref:DUF3016 domain-containing protein n=1 Tax=Shewanella sp. TaxID=50422 RepID=UPI003A96ED71